MKENYTLFKYNPMKNIFQLGIHQDFPCMRVNSVLFTYIWQLYLDLDFKPARTTRPSGDFASRDTMIAFTTVTTPAS
jgi:hypothetical protein